MAIKVVCKECDTINKVKNVTLKYENKEHPESAMSVEFRVSTLLNGNYSILHKASSYKEAENFCWQQDCPFDLIIEKRWVKKKATSM